MVMFDSPVDRKLRSKLQSSGLRLLDYLGGEGKLDPLYIGKIGLRHVPIVEELQYRKILNPAPLRPRFLHGPEAERRLDRLARGMDVIELTARSDR